MNFHFPLDQPAVERSEQFSILFEFFSFFPFSLLVTQSRLLSVLVYFMMATKDGDRIERAPEASPVVSASSRDLDDNYEVYKKNVAISFDAAESKKVLRKLDTRLMPILFFLYVS